MVTSIITPVWNKSSLTHKFLYHNWLLYKNRPEVEFVIVDNGSTDNTAKILELWRKTMGKRLSVKKLTDNRGFSAGNNAGAANASGDLLIFLSNDVTPFGDYVQIIQYIIGDNMLVGAEYLDYDTGWNKFDGKLFPYLTGWCIAALVDTWQLLGGWDERYFPCDYEDIDLSQTAREAGIELKPVSLPLQHAFGQTAQQLSGGREKITLVNRGRFIDKWIRA